MGTDLRAKPWSLVSRGLSLSSPICQMETVSRTPIMICNTTYKPPGTQQESGGVMVSLTWLRPS